jgi:NAD(P)-dependent dehydrogenase (short-subunit alcohol dehydrogenase family)
MTQKVAFITGAAQGIGRRTAEVLAGQGYALALNDLHSVADVAHSLKKFAVPVLECPGDVSNEGTVEGFAKCIQGEWGHLDVLINNAGISFISPTLSVSVAEFRRVLDINLVAPFLLARIFAPFLMAQRSGSIVNVASIAGLVGISERAAYNASKHGLIGLTRTLSAEWGGYGVRVNAVCPGWVKTEMDVADQASAGYTDTDITKRVPLARFATADDVAQAIAFLADPRLSGYITGHALTVDGGWVSDGSWEALRLRYRKGNEDVAG